MAALLLLIGIPGSGKSSLAAQFQRGGCSVVATDQIRKLLFNSEATQGSWALIWQAVEQQLQAAKNSIIDSTIISTKTHPTVYDATNCRRQSRRAVIRLAREMGYSRITGLWLNPPLEICLARNQQRQRQVPDQVIRRMHQQLRSSPPKLSEGLDLLLHYGGIDSPDWLYLADESTKYGNFASSSAKTEPG